MWRASCSPRTGQRAKRTPVVFLWRSRSPLRRAEDGHQGSFSASMSDIREMETCFMKEIKYIFGKFLYNLVKDQPDTSVVMSSYSSMFLLAQLAMYASGQSQTELLNLLHLRNKDEITSSIPEIYKSLEDQQNIILNMAAKSYVNAKYSLSDSYKSDTKTYFKAEAENVDFSNPRTAAQIINSWVADHTNNKIKNLITPSDLSSDTQVVLANAIYFMGRWVKPFELDRTKPADFYTSKEETVRVDMMNMENTFKYAELEDLNAKALELGYLNRNFSFLVVLPNNKKDDTNLITKLIEPAAIRSIKQNMKYEKVDVSLPKFETTTSIDLKSILQKASVLFNIWQVGVDDIFSPGTTGLNGIIEGVDTLFVSSAIQKANIIVDEVGSEASAANAFLLVGASFNPEPPKVFNADHPFVYYILFQDNPIFCGLFAGK
ncbi:antichymotrypsin-2-like [Epargyreus clarus]|uniref:antichymotrypsin-2-like n=1 Tax=Epargyreus clarus TaxID=520877 RepID=UPI003C2E3610